ncbi:MAG: GNAT family N-acetyltransferase [Clostridia bacterium]|nr:GNAT family N-acetyltransferase [Clostridia bacterium]
MDIEISGKTLVLRPMTQKEHRALWRKYLPDAVTPGNARTFEYDEEKTDALFEALNEKADWCPAAGIFTKNDEIVGMIQLPRVIYSERRSDVYLLIANETLRGKGYGTDALELALEFAKRQMSLTRVYAEVPANNARMIRVLQKCGFMNTRGEGERRFFVKVM